MLGLIALATILQTIGALIMTYNLAQGFNENWSWAAMGAVVMIGGHLLLYAAFRPVVM